MQFTGHDKLQIPGQGLSRRRLLSLGILTATSCIVPHEALASISNFISPARTLSLYNYHTNENLETTYWQQGAYVPEALDQLNHILRDHRTDEVKSIDADLLDLLYVLHSKLKSCTPFHIISGYRSPKTNSLLRKQSKGVAKKSLHTRGKAIDIYLPGCNLKDLRRIAVKIRGGGVGYYPRSGFLHLDVGRVRQW